MRHPEVHAADAAAVVAQRLLHATGLDQHLRVNRVVRMHAEVAAVHGPDEMLPALCALRPATLADAPAIAAIAGTPVELVEERLLGGRVGIVVEDQLTDELVGEAWFFLGPGRFPDDAPALPAWELPAGRAWEHAVAVRESHRGHGLFGHMIRFGAEHLAGVHGVRELACMVHHRNFASLHAHERAGFQRVDTMTFVHSEGIFGRAAKAATAVASLVSGPFINLL